MQMERKVSYKNKDLEIKNHKNLEIKSLDDYGRFSGYASVFNIEDSYKDIMLPNSFKKTLHGRNIKKDIKLLWQHSPEEPIGVFNVIKEDSVGLYVEGQLLMDVARAKEAYSLIKNGSISGLSIGYNVNEAFINKDTGVRVISDVDLWEISVVTFPANHLSNITYVKNNEFFMEKKKGYAKHNKGFNQNISDFENLNNSIEKIINILN